MKQGETKGFSRLHSLRTKIILLTISAVVFAVAMVTLLSVVFTRNTENDKSDQLMLLLCETGEQNLDYYFSSVENSVGKVSSFIRRDIEGLDEEQLRAHLDRTRVYFDEIANKTNGVFTYYYRIDPAVSETVKGFWYTNIDSTDFVEHDPTDITQYDLEDTTQLVWFTVPRKTGKAIWLPPYVTENLGERVISYNEPVYYRGQFIGVIGIEIDYGVMAKQVESIHLYKEGYAFLTDADGVLIFHPQMDIAETTAERNRSVLPEGVLSESTFVTYTFNGVRKEAAWQRLENGMRLYVCLPAEETDGDWQRLIRIVLLVGAGVILLTAGLAWLFSVQVTKPLKQLTAAAKQTDEGNYDFTLNYNGRDEVGVLTNTFRRMAGHMKEHINDLNKRAYVDALTSVRNKAAYTAYIEEMQAKLEKEPKEGAAFGAGIFDCDNLKTVNDRFGHEKGDLYLKNTSRLICKVFNHSPVFRIGGDEFAVILRNDDLKNREALMKEFERGMEESWQRSDDLWEQVSASMGIAVYDERQDRTVMDTVRRADSAMYLNKRKRKGD